MIFTSFIVWSIQQIERLFIVYTEFLTQIEIIDDRDNCVYDSLYRTGDNK